MSDLPPNHHADYPQFTGLLGFFGGLTNSVARGKDAGFVCDQADLGATDTVLDIGCGTGTAARVASRRSAATIGLDPSVAMLRWARLLSLFRLPRRTIQWVKAGAEASTLADASVSVCWTIKALHHWPDLEGGLTETARVLQPGGRFLALEKKTEPGATGNASHGWTPAQAELLGEMLPGYGFSDVQIAEHEIGGKAMMMVSAVR